MKCTSLIKPNRFIHRLMRLWFARCLSAVTGISIGLVFAMLGASAHAAGNVNPNAAKPAVVPATTITKLSFASLGLGNLELRGLQTAGYTNFGTRSDEVITSAKLHLRLTYSPSLLPELSHLRISLNQQVLIALPLPKEQAGAEMERVVDLDPRLFTDYNQLRFDLIGHYSLQCEDPQHSSLWLTISPQSWLELGVSSLELRNELALLPAPFFDRRDNQRLELPMLLPTQPAMPLLHAAGIAASWFGMLADYRGARFPVAGDTLPDKHALVFATNTSHPSQLPLADVNEPTISIIDNPTHPRLKLLVFQGKDDVQLEQAVMALVIGNPVFSGDRVTVKDIKSSPRAAYDVPRWLRSDRPVKLGELVDSTYQLQATGIAPAPIGVNLRLPPDLFTWNRTGVPFDLRYRYSAPLTADNSVLSVSINNQLLRTYRLRADDEVGSGGKLRIPLLNSADVQQRDDLVIPAFQLASSNQMQFQFALQYHRDAQCRDVFADPSREAIDPDSTIDISSFAHYTALPNLALFANAGYPFTRYADLSHTGVVLPDLQRASLEQLFYMLGRMGRHTGVAATRYQLLNAEQASKAKNLDLLLLSGEATTKLLNDWQQSLSLRMSGSERAFRDGVAAPSFMSDPLRLSRESRHADAVTFNTNGSLSALSSFESPLSSAYTVVALSATDSEAGNNLVNALDDGGKVAQIRGDLAIVRGGEVQSFTGNEVYYVGSLPWFTWLWFHLSRHPVLLTLVAIAMAIATAMLAYGWLQTRLRKRMNAMQPQSTNQH